MGTYSSGLIAVKPVVRKTQLLTGLFPEQLEYRGKHNEYYIYEIPSMKWYGMVAELIRDWIKTLNKDDFIYAVVNEDGHIHSTHGDLDEVNFVKELAEYDFCISSPIASSTPV